MNISSGVWLKLYFILLISNDLLFNIYWSPDPIIVIVISETDNKFLKFNIAWE